MRKTSYLLLTLLLFAAPLDAEELKIISLAPSTTEILFALGLGENVIGVSTYCNYPAEVTDYPKVGSFSQPNIEIISYLNPDIIFAAGLEQAPPVDRLRQLGFRVVVVDRENINGLYDSIIAIGQITGKENEARQLLLRMKESIQRIKSKTIDIPQENRPRVFLELWHRPLMTTGASSFVGEAIEIAGGYNIAYDTPRDYSRFSSEVVIDRNPDVIIIGHKDGVDQQELLSQRYGWDGIKAVREGRIYDDIDPDLILRPGPRIAEGIKKLYERFYPEN